MTMTGYIVFVVVFVSLAIAACIVVGLDINMNHRLDRVIKKENENAERITGVATCVTGIDSYEAEADSIKTEQTS